jgi:hypothetical protein
LAKSSLKAEEKEKKEEDETYKSAPDLFETTKL